MFDEQVVTITKKEYDRLKDSEAKLCALQEGGVDNWSFYSEAMSSYWKSKEEDEE